MGLWYYRVRVEETRKGLSYLRSMGAVTGEGNFNTLSTSRLVLLQKVLESRQEFWALTVLLDNEGG